MTRYGMVVDLTKCIGCYNCFMACRDEYCGNDYPGYSAPQPMSGHFWMKVIERERGEYPKVKVAYTVVPCLHCDNAPCIEAGLGGSVYRREDGIVIIDPQKAKGQSQIVSACPYRVIYWNKELELPQKCTMCAHLLDAGWKEPRCVEACPTGALVFGDLDDPNSEVAKLAASDKAEPLHPEYGLKDKVTYIGLPKRFVAGAVYDPKEDKCLEGAIVTLKDLQTGKELSTRTDNFGDFWFEGLSIGTYSLVIEKSEYRSKKVDLIGTEKDVNLGDLELLKK
jgi:Fe-S-cluster-containing dehydrogenase component